MTREAGTAASAPAALGTIADQLPVYSGLIETARTNNRLGYPIGAAYLRQAASLMTSQILPAADHLYRIEAERLNDDYHAGTATSALVTFVAASAVALILLCWRSGTWRGSAGGSSTSRWCVATVAVAAVSVWGIVGLVSEQNALETAQRNGSDSVEALSAATVLLSRAQGDLSLVARQPRHRHIDPLDFKVTRVLGRARRCHRRDLGAGAANRDDRRRQAVRLPTTPRIRRRPARSPGSRTAASSPARSRLAPQASAISEQLSHNLAQQIAAAQARFTRAAADATSALDGLGFAIPLITVLAAVLALIGLRQRINEYR